MNTAEYSAKINGLVLAGGKSMRMGFDKGRIKWYEKEHRYYLADLLKKFCTEVYISLRADQAATIDSQYRALADESADMGPAGAILSAFHYDPAAAWLVVACDLPLLDEQTIRYLVMNREPGLLATCFKTLADNLPEPLITIWEPAACTVFENMMAAGILSPRKILLSSAIKMLDAPVPGALLNVNTPADTQFWQSNSFE